MPTNLKTLFCLWPDGLTVCSMSVKDEVLGKVLLTSY